MSDPQSSTRIDRLDGDVRSLRQDMNNALQAMQTAVARMDTVVSVIKAGDEHRAQRLVESEGWRNEQFKGIRESVERLEKDVNKRMDGMQSAMVTKGENLPARVIGVGTLVAALIAMGGFVVQGWHWMTKTGTGG